MKFTRKHLSNTPLMALVVANLIPLWGVIFLEWDVFNIVLLYWAENIIVGFYNILRMAIVKEKHPVGHLEKLIAIPFFVLHYGGFTAGHGFCVLGIFKKGAHLELIQGEEWPCFLVFVQLLVNVIKQAYSVISVEMKFVLLALFISHGVSFVHNYLLKGEYLSAKVDDLMVRPYARIVVMHITVIAGAILSQLMGSPVVLLVVLVFLKTILDVKLHLREHKKMQN